MKSCYWLVLALLLLLISPVAADMYSDETILIDTEYSDYFAKVATVYWDEPPNVAHPANGIIMSKSLSVPEFESMFAQMPASSVTNYNSLPASGQAKVSWHKSSYTGSTGALYMSGTYGYFKYTAGGAKYLQIWAEFDDPVSQLTGPTYLKCVLQEGESIVWPIALMSQKSGSYQDSGGMLYNALVTDTSGIKATFACSSPEKTYIRCISGANVRTYPVLSGTWKNGLRIETIEFGGVPRAQIDITKEYDGYLGISDHYVKFGEDGYSVVGGTKNAQYFVLESQYPFTVSIYNAQNDKWYNSTYGEASTDPGDPGDPTTLTVYIKNSQTGALIANSNIVIDALVDGEYYPVVNRSEPSGIFTINLQPTGGGPPNPDGYRLIVTADGYNNPMPEINFTVDDYKQSIYCLLDPIAGGPADENKTFIDFFVSDMYANPISGATVKFGKYTLITNSAGYTVFEVPKNDYYTYTVSKSGYNTITGNVNIGDAPRNTINTYLTPVITPTTPTHIPTGPPTGPTPVMTAPTGEPVNNWLEWFAAHFGMILGGGVEIGKIFMWLCFTVPVGVYVGKEAKAGAAGFMAGAGIVTLFFVLIGWVPIWLVVLLALIIGLLYAKVFNTQDNGGGR